MTRADFSSVDRARSRRFFGTYFTMSVSSQSTENKADKPKFACVVSKKIAARAVDRNRIRRLCKEALRTASDPVVHPPAIIFYAKKESKSATFQDIAADIKKLLAQTS